MIINIYIYTLYITFQACVTVVWHTNMQPIVGSSDASEDFRQEVGNAEDRHPWVWHSICSPIVQLCLVTISGQTQLTFCWFHDVWPWWMVFSALCENILDSIIFHIKHSIVVTVQLWPNRSLNHHRQDNGWECYRQGSSRMINHNAFNPQWSYIQMLGSSHIPSIAMADFHWFPSNYPPKLCLVVFR